MSSHILAFYIHKSAQSLTLNSTPREAVPAKDADRSWTGYAVSDTQNLEWGSWAQAR